MEDQGHSLRNPYIAAPLGIKLVRVQFLDDSGD